MHRNGNEISKGLIRYLRPQSLVDFRFRIFVDDIYIHIDVDRKYVDRCLEGFVHCGMHTAQGVEWCLWSFVWFCIKDHDTDSGYVTSRLAMNKLGVKLLLELLSIKHFKNLWHKMMHEVISNSQYLWHTLTSVVSPLSAANIFFLTHKGNL